MNPAEQIDQYISAIPDWRGELLSQLRSLVHEAVPGIAEEWKWGSPVWTHNGLVCSASAFKDHVGMIFFQGASLEDHKGLFNSGLEAKKTRSINFFEGDPVDLAALTELVQEAAAYNAAKKTPTRAG